MTENNYSQDRQHVTEINETGLFMRRLASAAHMPDQLADEWVDSVLGQMRRVAAAADRVTQIEETRV